MFKNVNRLIIKISSQRKSQGLLLLFLMLFTAIVEIISIGAVIPFLTSVASPQILFDIDSVQKISRHLGIESPHQLTIAITLIFCFVSFFSAIIRLLYVWIQMRFSTAIVTDMGKLCFQNILSQSFYETENINSGELISTIFVKINLVLMHVIVPFLSIISSFILIFGIIIFFIFINPIVTILTFVGFGFSYLLSVLILRKRTVTHGKSINTNQNIVIKNLQHVIGSIKEILLGNLKDTYFKRFTISDFKLKLSQAKVEFYKITPRYIVELFMMIGFAVIAYLMLSDAETRIDNLAFLSALALSSIKIFPVIQNIYSNWFSIQSHQSVFEDVLEKIELNHFENDQFNGNDMYLPFNNNINLQINFFKFPNANNELFKDASINIKKGEKVILTGTTGSGKSTLIDFIIGLRDLTDGSIKIDDVSLERKYLKSLQSRIGYVPQSVFILNESVRENISIGITDDKLDNHLFKKPLEMTQLKSTIESWRDGLDTIIGDGGQKISGGEAQRIGIARALFRDPEILIFDESTNSLDSTTESLILKSILETDLTFIFITHQVPDLSLFDRVLKIENGNIIEKS